MATPPTQLIARTPSHLTPEFYGRLDRQQKAPANRAHMRSKDTRSVRIRR